MVDPRDVPRILSDAARLVARGRIVVFGSAALALRIPNAPGSRDVDVWCEPEESGDLVTAVMGELSWYQDKHAAYVEVWGPETFLAPSDWLTRAQELTNPDAPDVVLVVPHPHDILMSKLERWEPQDRAHAALILATFPLSRADGAALVARTPHRTGTITDPARIATFEAHAADLLDLLPA